VQRGEARTFALVGSSGAGKTTLLEAMIHASGGSERLRRPDDGTSVLDGDPEARRRGMSVGAAAAGLVWRGTTLHALDTPGYLDFAGEVRAALRAADLALVAVDAAGGVDAGAEAAWAHAEATAELAGRPVPRMVVVTRLDRLPSDRAPGFALPEGLAELGGRGLVPLQVPVWRAGRLRALVDLVDGTLRDAGTGEVAAGPEPGTGLPPEEVLPAEVRALVAAARQALVELAAEQDDELLARYLDGQSLEPAALRAALRRGVAAGAVVPLCYVAAGAPDGVAGGVRALLDALVDLAPAPADLPLPAVAADGRTVPVAAEPAGPLLALCWKTVADPYVGRLALLRVFRGTLRLDAHPVSVRPGRVPLGERVGQMLGWPGGEPRPATEAGPGSVVAVPKLQHTLAGDTLADPACPLALAWPAAPEPVYGLAVIPGRRADEERLGPALARLCEEDPSLRVVHRAETHQTVLLGGGELHLEVAIARLQRKFGVQAETAPPRVPFRETIRRPARAEGKYKKQTGGHGQYGHVVLEVAPLPRGAGLVFRETIFGGAVPRQYIPAVEKGVQEAMQTGVLAGYPVTDIQVTLTDGSHHPVDSSDLAFKLAAGIAFRRACEEAGPLLLEPVGELVVEVPEACLGEVLGDLQRRRAHVHGMEPVQDHRAVPHALRRLRATVPLVEVGAYAIDLRSLTAGRGRFSLAFARYEPAPPQVLAAAVAAAPSRERAAAE
jgi:elongation factor G